MKKIFAQDYIQVHPRNTEVFVLHVCSRNGSGWNSIFLNLVLKRLRGFGGAGNTIFGTVIIKHYNSGAKNNTNKQESNNNQRLTK